MNLETFMAYCRDKKGAEEAFPFGPQAVWYKIGGKAFAWTFVESFKMDGEEKPPFTFINMKCDPEQAVEWREQHEAVQPGWHQSKKHWNSVFMDGDIPVNLSEMLDHAYEVVFKSLPKKIKESI